MERSMKTGTVVILMASLVALAVVSTLTTGCDSAVEDLGTVETTEESELYAVVSSDLNLTTEQASHLRRMLARHDHFEPEPGFLWILADSLHGSLTERQIERLLNRDFGEHGFHRWGRGFRNGRSDAWSESGQGRHGRARFGREGRMAGHFLRGVIDLTDEQKQAIEQIRDEKRDQIEALAEQMRNGDISREGFRTAMDEIRDATRTEIEAILTEEQKAELERVLEDKKAEWEIRREEARQVRNQVLGLTDAEAAAFDEIVDGLMEAGRALHEQVRNGELTRDQARDQRQANRDSADETLRALLSDDQYEVVQIRHALGFRIGRGPGFGRHFRWSGGW